MDARHRRKSLAYLILLLFGALLFGISLPAGVIIYLIIPGFFPGGTFSIDIIYTWDGLQIGGAIVLTILFIAFEIFCIVTTVNVIKELVRRGKERKAVPAPTFSMEYTEEFR
jgi:hypothetical protein